MIYIVHYFHFLDEKGSRKRGSQFQTVGQIHKVLHHDNTLLSFHFVFLTFISDITQQLDDHAA